MRFSENMCGMHRHICAVNINIVIVMKIRKFLGLSVFSTDPRNDHLNGLDYPDVGYPDHYLEG